LQNLALFWAFFPKILHQSIAGSDPAMLGRGEGGGNKVKIYVFCSFFKKRG